MNLMEFTKHLIGTGCYIGEDNHIYRKNGTCISRLCRNGYYLSRKMIDGTVYHFMEHRVIWCWINGEFDETLVINHIDFDRANNDIKNLELVTQKENVEYTIKNGRTNYAKGCSHEKAILTEEDVAIIRFLNENGWKQKEIAKLLDLKHANIVSRVINGTRYGSVQTASDIVTIYPFIVNKTTNTESTKEERILNYTLGLAGEAGECVDMIKKWTFHKHELDVNELLLEFGDVLYYLTALANEFDINISDICFANMDKLNKRYPEGFSCEASVNRKE